MSDELKRFESETVLFAQHPVRLAVQRLFDNPSGGQKVSVNLWRNHAFEPVASLIMPYAFFGRWQPDFRYSDYDDSLMFDHFAPADAELLWLDSTRYLQNSSFNNWLDWLTGRLRALRNMTNSPILIATWVEMPTHCESLQHVVDGMPAIYFCDLGATCTDATVKLLDSRTAEISGSPISPTAQTILARKLATQWLPAAVLPPIKAIALDLDNTLHAGVLGEDGIEGVTLSPEHLNLQEYLITLQKRGLFLVLVSRNEHADVKALFARRDDYPLKWEDFSAAEISWGDKAEAILRIANKLRISPDAVLFVDDNPGELSMVANQLPQLHTIYALHDASVTKRAIEYYPGVWRWKIQADDVIRVHDLKASEQREALLAVVSDPSDYFRSLEVSITFRVDPLDQISRLADLCNKTNQFNLALRRLKEAELADHCQHSNACVVSVQLSDRLSDSGVIAVIAGHRHDDILTIEELCVSCRALGRKLEDTIILGGIQQMPIFAGCNQFGFKVEHAPRNQPALNWLVNLLDLPGPPDPGIYYFSAQTVAQFVPPVGITILRG
jgi:FkbH-like protein